MSTAPHHSWFKSGLRFCGSSCLTIGCWAVWIVLAASLAILAYIALAKELPVPGLVLRQVEARLADLGPAWATAARPSHELAAEPIESA